MKPFSVTKKWKRIMAVGCSHGVYADPKAIAAVLKFKQEFKPVTTVHLGDFCDTTAFRAGAAGGLDEAVPVQPDIDGGLDFLKALRPTLILCGNHEGRVWRLATHFNAIVSECAKSVVERIETRAKLLKAELIPYKGVWAGKTIGGYFYTHGSIYGENATRDMAEMHGSVVHAHTHRCSVSKGRRSDSPTGYCVGTLTNTMDTSYAQARRSTLAWSQGFVFGEYLDDKSVLWLHDQPRNTEWRLPI